MEWHRNGVADLEKCFIISVYLPKSVFVPPKTSLKRSRVLAILFYAEPNFAEYSVKRAGHQLVFTSDFKQGGLLRMATIGCENTLWHALVLQPSGTCSLECVAVHVPDAHSWFQHAGHGGAI